MFVVYVLNSYVSKIFLSLKFYVNIIGFYLDIYFFGGGGGGGGGSFVMTEYTSCSLHGHKATMKERDAALSVKK